MKNLISLALVACTCAFVSCKKNTDGGKAELHVMINHLSDPIMNATVYVKYDATKAPANPTSDYDMKLQGSSITNHVHVEGLRYGQYYLYAVGYSDKTKQTLSGGTPVTIKWSERKETKEVDIQITE